MSATNIVLAELLAAELEKNAALEAENKELRLIAGKNELMKIELENSTARNNECSKYCNSLISRLGNEKQKAEDLAEMNKKLASKIVDLEGICQKLTKERDENKILSNTLQLNLQDEKQKAEKLAKYNNMLKSEIAESKKLVRYYKILAEIHQLDL